MIIGQVSSFDGSVASDLPTVTPIKHLVVIFQENQSFDSYFGLYPNAANPPGQPKFEAHPGTPSVNGYKNSLLQHKPKESNPFRSIRVQSFTSDQDRDYTTEEWARNGGLMDKFVKFDAKPPIDQRQFCHKNSAGHWDTALGYFNWNTVTAL